MSKSDAQATPEYTGKTLNVGETVTIGKDMGLTFGGNTHISFIEFPGVEGENAPNLFFCRTHIQKLSREKGTHFIALPHTEEGSLLYLNSAGTVELVRPGKEDTPRPGWRDLGKIFFDKGCFHYLHCSDKVSACVEQKAQAAVEAPPTKMHNPKTTVGAFAKLWELRGKLPALFRRGDKERE